MTENYNKEPMLQLSMVMGEKDDTMFEDTFDTLYQADLSNASRTDLVLVLGMAVGTMMRLRARIKELEAQLNDQ